MNILVVYPGRFHPFHLGHKASYDWLLNRFGEGVYIATSDVQNPEDSPFSFADKVKMMTHLGVPASHVVQVKNPYRADEIVNTLSDEERAETALVFAVSRKDADRFNFKPKKDGTPSYLQPLPDKLNKLKPMTEHGYVAITPTVNFRVQGRDANSASEIRKLYAKGNKSDRAQIITDLYGAPDPALQSIFDAKIGNQGPEEIIRYGKPIVDGGSQEVGIMHEHRRQLIQKIEHIREQLNRFRKLNLNEQTIQDYIDEKNRH